MNKLTCPFHIRTLTARGLLAGLFVAALSLEAALVLAPTPARAACAPLPTAKGTATLSVGVPAAGTYRVWLREQAPASRQSGVYVQIADAGLCQAGMGGTSLPAGTWTWVNYQNADPTNLVNVNLASGAHTVELAGLDTGVEVDKIMLLTDTGCVPAGDGSNCAVDTSPAAGTAGSASSSDGGAGGGLGVGAFVEPGAANGSAAKSGAKSGAHLTYGQRLAANIQAHRLPIILLTLVVIAVPVLWLADDRFNLWSHLRRFRMAWAARRQNATNL